MDDTPVGGNFWVAAERASPRVEIENEGDDAFVLVSASQERHVSSDEKTVSAAQSSYGPGLPGPNFPRYCQAW
ncbi:hypothetical protein L596_001823 [Steinernema carpocapsae]|uniref:Uncharacterized protein n=1 Tax=Steinernema carpocapsae TaxID=34508 RepID=A0A4U8UMC4_STECR|nr:hypothetical protein L596_001823 [Steinernema carpocapsae]